MGDADAYDALELGEMLRCPCIRWCYMACRSTEVDFRRLRRHAHARFGRRLPPPVGVWSVGSHDFDYFQQGPISRGSSDYFDFGGERCRRRAVDIKR